MESEPFQSPDERSELARRIVACFEQLSVEEALRICHPDVELKTLYDEPGEQPFRGHEGLQEWFARMRELWAFIDIREWSFEEHGDTLLVYGRARVRGRASPNELELEWSGIGRVENGRLSTLGLFVSRDEALAAIREADG